MAETYERVVNRESIPEALRQGTAMEAIRKNAGTQFDPEVASVVKIMQEETSGGYSRAALFQYFDEKIT